MMKTTFKTTRLFGGEIREAASWVAHMFGYKAKTRFGRLVWYVFSTCASILALIVAVGVIAYTVELVGDCHSRRKQWRLVNSPTYLHSNDNQYVGPYIIYYGGLPYGYIYNTQKGVRTLTGIHWICKSSDGDSLACFSTIEEHKRGYFNRFTGEEVIPAQYKKAWIFSEGVACVMDGGALHFIDHKGHTTMDKKFAYTPRIDDYCFHNGLCAMQGDNGHLGLIDKQGNWVVSPDYSWITYDTKGFWLIQDSDWNYGLLDSNGQVLLPIDYKDIAIDDNDSCIYVWRLDHLNQVLDFDCNVINPCNFNDVEKMYYETGEYDEDGNLEYASANNLRYRTSEWYYGLMGRSGNIVTPPSYSSIEAIGPDRYQCDGPHGTVILDDKGNECVEKL